MCGNIAVAGKRRGTKSGEQARAQEEADEDHGSRNEGHGHRTNLSSTLQLQLARECGAVLRWFADGTPPPQAGVG